MHGYPVMQVVQYSVPTCTWGPPPPDILHRPPSTGNENNNYIYLHSINALLK